jgi:hypothetical protein
MAEVMALSDVTLSERACEEAENALSDCHEEQIYQANPWDQALLDSSAQALARERAGSIGIDSGKLEEELKRDREMRLQSGKDHSWIRYVLTQPVDDSRGVI